MKEFIKLLNENIGYLTHEIINDTIYIYVVSLRESVVCPYCKEVSTKVHSYYERSFQDLPIQGKKVILIIKNRKMFCPNPDCDKKTFAESFDFLRYKAKKTKRLEDEIVNVSINISSLAAEQLLKNSVVNVGKSTICNLLKKRGSNS